MKHLEKELQSLTTKLGRDPKIVQVVAVPVAGDARPFISAPIAQR